MAPSATFLPDLRSPRSPKRFFTFTRDPLPPLPLPPLPPSFACSPTPIKVSHTPNSSYSSYASTNSSSLGHGAQVVRRPSDARRAMRQPLTAGLVSSSSSKEDLHSPAPTSAPLLRSRPSQPSMKYSETKAVEPVARQGPSPGRDRQSILRVKTSIASPNSLTSPFYEYLESDWDTRSRRTTVRPPLKSSPPSSFAAILLSHTTRPSPTSSSHILITLSFAYSLDDPPTNTPATIPWSKVRPAGGHLVSFVQKHLGDRGRAEVKPEMTDVESAEESELESDYGLDALLRDEYLKSLLLVVSPQDKADLPPRPARPPKSNVQPLPLIESCSESKKRPHTRNQYTQKLPFPSPSSPLLPRPTEPLNIRRQAPSLKLEPREVEGGGTITELKILLLRDAAMYGPIVHRLIHGTFPTLDGRKKSVESECVWLGMEGLGEELVGRLKGRKSLVLKGGEGYI